MDLGVSLVIIGLIIIVVLVLTPVSLFYINRLGQDTQKCSVCKDWIDPRDRLGKVKQDIKNVK